MARPRLFTAVSGIALLAVLAGCDGSDKKQSSADHYKKAVEFRAKGDVASALIETKNALQADDKNGQAQLLRAQILLDSGDAAGAEDELRAASANGVPPGDWFPPLGRALLEQEKYPKVRDLIAQLKTTDPALQAKGKAFLADVALKSGDREGARKGFQDALAQNDKDMDALLGMTLLAAEGGDLDTASSYLAKARAIEPHNPEAFSLEAGIDTARHDSAAAEEALRQASAAAPANPRYRLLLAQTLVENQKNQEAQGLLDALLKRNPGQPIANHLRAELLYRDGKFKEVDDIETDVLSKIPTMRQAQFLDGLAKYALGQYAQAEHLLNGIDIGGTSGDVAAMIRGASLLQLGRPQEAYKLLKPLQAKLSGNPQFLLLAADAARITRDLPASQGFYEQALARDPKNPAILTQLASVKLDLGDTTGGKAALDQAAADVPTDEKTQSLLFTTLLRGQEYDKAMNLAKKAQADNPTEARGWVMEGMIDTLQKKNEEAIASFTKALQVDPAAADAAGNLAAVYIQQGRIDLARTAVEDGYKHSPKSTTLLAMGSQVESAAKNPAGMQVWLERYLEIDPKNSTARATLVDALLQQNQPQKALATALTGRQTTPGDAVALRSLGQAYLAAKQPNEAAATLRDLVAADPSADNYFALSQVYFQLHDESRLRDSLEQLVQKAPDYRPGRILLARVLLDDKTSIGRAETMITQLAAEKADDPQVVELQARLAAQKTGPKSSIPILQKYMTDSKTQPRDLILLLASAQWESGQQDLSAKTLGDWMKAHPDDSAARMTLATRQIQAKRYDDANKTLSEEIRVNPNDWVAQNNLAWVLMTKGDLVGAQAQIDSAHKLAGTQPDVLDTEGQIALARGDAPRAVDLLKLATLSGTPAPSIRIHLARALIASGNPKDAVDTLKSVVATVRTGPDADEAKALLATIKN
jgi:putative PEP-CTERM system TPR-repeat lipoprotein